MPVGRIPWGYVIPEAEKNGLDKNWVAACIMTETRGETYATRYEPAWSYWFESRKDIAENLSISVETETVHQATSWGEMQGMGAVARQHGFDRHLPELTDVQLGIKYGCLHLGKLFKKYGNIHDAIAAYNAGSVRKTPGGMYVNQKHVDRFDNYLRQFQSEAI